ncbi:hypothetical protein H257_00141 [Aphanomyces astaci]|uniref:EGF-like domain-containing protein n=2 Tax=Aphanomyces astaci TaxID=112090 RepID=W4HBG3_APHAT|nr:hypothetical protein H257_00141 [Aphanomyces astaci]ETV88589.1 hypothetical protein H257_00141 [Aphanomyces astaci]|eukprot:XP_009820989.1 hypothetical protein H257_00141 [Aphanomyces astaci]
MAGRWVKALLGLSALAVLSVEGACPNKCSGHGSCGANDICSCEQNWINADCSARQCPFTRAWQDTASYNNDAHYYAECGNRGICDRSTGICQCDETFVGSGCRRLKCPSDCSGHGKCQFIEDLAVSTDKRVGGNPLFIDYTSWDREKIQGCRCDPGWEGHSCNRRVCPQGDDPLTTGQYDMQQGITITHSAVIKFVIRYADPYGNLWTTSEITSGLPTADATTCTNIETALRRIPNFALSSRVLNSNEISVKPGGVGAYTRTGPTTGTVAATVADITTATNCIVTFPAAPGTTGLQSLLEVDVTPYTAAGSQPISAGGGAATVVVVEHIPGSNAAGALARPLTELATCSNRGVCNAETGQCQCYAGHKGLACELQEALV